MNLSCWKLHCLRGMRNWLFLGDGRPQIVQEQVSVPKWQSWIFVKLYGHKIKGRIRAQGLGLHSDQEMQALMIKDLRTVSRIIGKKKFLLGDEPCSDDAAVFGFLAGFVLAFMRDSPYGKFIQGKGSTYIDLHFMFLHMSGGNWECEQTQGFRCHFFQMSFITWTGTARE